MNSILSGVSWNNATIRTRCVTWDEYDGGIATLWVDPEGAYIEVVDDDAGSDWQAALLPGGWELL